MVYCPCSPTADTAAATTGTATAAAAKRIGRCAADAAVTATAAALVEVARQTSAMIDIAVHSCSRLICGGLGVCSTALGCHLHIVHNNKMPRTGAVSAVGAVACNVVPWVSSACAALTANACHAANAWSTAVAALTAITAVARVFFQRNRAVCSQLIMFLSITAHGCQATGASEKKILVRTSHIYTGLTRRSLCVQRQTAVSVLEVDYHNAIALDGKGSLVLGTVYHHCSVHLVDIARKQCACAGGQLLRHGAAYAHLAIVHHRTHIHRGGGVRRDNNGRALSTDKLQISSRSCIYCTATAGGQKDMRVGIYTVSVVATLQRCQHLALVAFDIRGENHKATGISALPFGVVI